MNAVTHPAKGREAASPPLDVERVRRDFPVLARIVNGHPLAYLDNAASSQRPHSVIDAVSHYYEHSHANVHRGVHALSQEATDLFEGARRRVQRFVNARSPREIVFVRGTTEAINLVAQSWGRSRLRPGDEILVSHLEHHANIVPWQLLCEQTSSRLRVIPMTRAGELDFEAFMGLLSERTRLLALAHVSNALGTIVPVDRFVAEARRRGIPVLLDGAQAVPHMKVDVQALDCDFYCFSSHKMCGPTGIGVLYGREALLNAMPPWQGGGDMILAVSFERTIYNEVPHKFEAGTPHIAGAVGLAAAIDYLEGLGLDRIAATEHELLADATERLLAIPGLTIVGRATEKCAVVSFTLDGVHPHDLGTILDHQGIAIRTGHHCAMPVMEYFGVPATARASFSFYNTHAEVERLAAAVQLARGMFA
jgi:cysteine desulfurase/selenocysteine lyase